MNSTGALAAFASAIAAHGLPAEVVAHARRLILDQLGVQVHAARYPWSQATYRAIARGGIEESTILTLGTRVPAETAAFVNAAFGHGIEFDDVHSAAMTHPGCVVIPAAVAMGEATRASGAALLESIVAGFEVMLRIAWAGSPSLLERGHHTPPAAGPFGAAVAAGRLMRLDARLLEQCLAVASSFSGGLMEYTQSGGSVKRVHASIPAQGGIQAARLAAAGVTGPAAPLEGKRGFLRVFADLSDESRLTDRLGDHWLLATTSIKAYAANASIHPALEAIDIIRRRQPFDLDAIERIRVGVSKDHVVRVGAIREPTDTLGAQFSLPFSLALRLIGGSNDPADYSDERLGDEAILRLAQRIDVFEDEAAEQERGRRFTAIVHVATIDGGILSERVTGALGTPDAPMSDEQVRAKFLRLTEPVLGQTRAREAADAVEALASLKSVDELTALLVDPAGVSPAGSSHR